MDDNKAQLAALGAHRCGSPRCPHAHEDECAAEHTALREELATVTRERDARHPTDGEGDAHEGKAPAFTRGECFVPGGWTGRRCLVCGRWEWGGPTVHVGCALANDARAERDALAKRCEWFRAAHMLAAQEHLFLSPPAQGGPFVYNGAALAVYEGEPTLWVNCNDTFAWACADAERAEYADAPDLLRLGVTEGWPGLVRWVQARRVAREEPAECIPQVQEMIATSDSLRAERDALRGALMELVAADTAMLAGKIYAMDHAAEEARMRRAWEQALDVLGRVP